MVLQTQRRVVLTLYLFGIFFIGLGLIEIFQKYIVLNFNQLYIKKSNGIYGQIEEEALLHQSNIDVEVYVSNNVDQLNNFKKDVEDDKLYQPNDVYNEDVYNEEYDDTSSFFNQIENAQISPVHMIGKYPELSPGVTIVLLTKGSVSFPKNCVVLLTLINRDVYEGVILNVELSLAEQIAAQKSLRLNTQKEGLNRKNSEILFYGYGGPVHDGDNHKWSVLHDQVNSPGVQILGTKLACNGDDLETILHDAKRVVLLYGRVVWLSGQLEREISEGQWKIASKLNEFRDLESVCHT